LFTAGWAISRRFRRSALFLQSLGVGAISVGGWMGGTLAYRNQIGVDHRYANAGRWQEDSRADAKSRALASAAAGAELEINQMELVHAGDERVAIARTEKGYAAFQDRCTHRGGPLSDGVLICGTVQCPWHGSQFDVHTGDVKCGPAEKNIKTYEIEPKTPATPELPSHPATQLPISSAVRRPRESSRP
jgi:nitrite reductase/ring-hydroxylating ferredoxin subunit